MAGLVHPGSQPQPMRISRAERHEDLRCAAASLDGAPRGACQIDSGAPRSRGFDNYAGSSGGKATKAPQAGRKPRARRDIRRAQAAPGGAARVSGPALTGARSFVYLSGTRRQLGPGPDRDQPGWLPTRWLVSWSEARQNDRRRVACHRAGRRAQARRQQPAVEAGAAPPPKLCCPALHPPRAAEARPGRFREAARLRAPAQGQC